MKVSHNKAIIIRTAILISANILAAAFGFAVITLIARMFGPSGLGEISLATTIIIYANLAASFGTDIFAVTTIASKRQSVERVIGTIVPLRLILSTIVFIVVVLLVFLIPQYSSIFYLVALFGGTLFSTSLILTWVPQALHKSEILALVNILLQFTYFVGLYVAFHYIPDLLLAPVIKLITEIIIAIGLFLWVKKQLHERLVISTLETLVNTLKDCAPIGATQLVRGLSLGSDIILLGLFVSHEQLGFYSSAHKIFLLLLSFGSAYFVIILPRFANLSSDLSAVNQELKSSFIRVFPVLFSVLVILFYSASFSLSLLFGSAFTEATVILQVLCIVVFVNIFSRHYRQVLLVCNHKEDDFRMSSRSCIIHLIAKIILIPLFGPIGCAIGTLLGECYLLFVQRIFARRILRNQI